MVHPSARIQCRTRVHSIPHPLYLSSQVHIASARPAMSHRARIPSRHTRTWTVSMTRRRRRVTNVTSRSSLWREQHPGCVASSAATLPPSRPRDPIQPGVLWSDWLRIF